MTFRIRLTSLLPICLLIFASLGAVAAPSPRPDEEPEPLTGSRARDAVDAITANYGEWDRLGFDGKIRSDLMPMGISPTIKVYMVKGERLQMSVRAPFVGEVAALDITPDSLMIANKYFKTYCTGRVRDLLPAATFTLSDIQSLLLGRIVLLGKGELSRKNMKSVEITDDVEGGWLIYPDDSVQPFGAEYCCLTYPDGTLQAVLLERSSPSGGADYEESESDLDSGSEAFSMLYTYPGKKTDIRLETVTNGRIFDATLTFDAPNPSASPLKDIKIPSGYTRVGISQLLKKVR